MSGKRTTIPSEHQYVETTVKAARAGSSESSKEIFQEFIYGMAYHCESTWPVSEVPWAYARYVADALQRVLTSKPDQSGVALGVARAKRGRPAGSAQYNAIQVASCFYQLLRSGSSRKAAKIDLNTKLGVSDDFVESAAKTYSRLKSRKKFDRDLLVALAGESQEKIRELIRVKS